MGEHDHRQIRRSGDDIVLTGLLGGLAEYLSVDSLLLRIAAVVLLFLEPPVALIAYGIGWLLVPDGSGNTIIGGRRSGDGPDRGPTAKPVAATAAGELVAERQRDPGPTRWILGSLLIVVGAMVLLDEYVPDIDAQDTGLAVALIIVGIILVARGARR